MSEPKEKQSREWRDFYVRHKLLGGQCVDLLKAAVKNDNDYRILLQFLEELRVS